MFQRSHVVRLQHVLRPQTQSASSKPSTGGTTGNMRTADAGVSFHWGHCGGCVFLSRSSSDHLPSIRTTIILGESHQIQVNYTSTVPYFLVKLIDCPFIKEYDLSNLFLIGCAASYLSGELEKKVAKTLHEANPSIDLAQGYGLTEAGIYFLRVPPKMFRLPGKEGSVGMKPTNVEFKIVASDDVDMKIEGAKEIGEIWLRTPAMMLGYYKQPEKTREAFSEDGWLKTGDIGYVDADKYLFLVNRVKHLIKCNSMNVSTAELENVLRSHPGVADAGVLGVPHPEMGEVPRAYVVRRNQNVTIRRNCANLWLIALFITNNFMEEFALLTTFHEHPQEKWTNLR